MSATFPILVIIGGLFLSILSAILFVSGESSLWPCISMAVVGTFLMSLGIYFGINEGDKS